MKFTSLFAAASLIAGAACVADAQTMGAGAPRQSIENRQARGAPAAVVKKSGTRCRILKRAGQDKQVCSKAPVRR